MSEDSGTSGGGDSVSTTEAAHDTDTGTPQHPAPKDIELVFKPHPELEEKDETGTQTRYIKTTGNASGKDLALNNTSFLCFNDQVVLPNYRAFGPKKSNVGSRRNCQNLYNVFISDFLAVYHLGKYLAMRIALETKKADSPDEGKMHSMLFGESSSAAFIVIS